MIAANEGEAGGNQMMMDEAMMMGGADAGDGAENEVDEQVIAAAFALGSPRFQKR